jgi:hypothetical protein
MGRKSWLLAAFMVAVLVAVASVVEWNARKQAHVAARELANGAPPLPVTVATTGVATPVVPASVVAAPVVPEPEPEPVVSAEERQLRAEALDASVREAREHTLEVQKRLRAEEAARRARVEAPKEGERCIDGQKMKRVQNGWVQDGEC